MPPPRLILTCGEPAGIGPDLCIDIAGRAWPCELVVAGDIEVLRARAQQLQKPLTFLPYAPDGARAEHRAGTLRVLHVPVASTVRPGQLDRANARHVLQLLDRAIDGCMAGEFAAMVTAPVQKSVINDAGIKFSGHTEYLAERTGGAHPVMMLANGSLRVALATTHLPIEGRERCDHRRAAAAGSAHRRPRPAHALRNSRASHRRVRTQSSRRRVRPSRSRGDRSHRAGARHAAPLRHAAHRPCARRHRIHRSHAAAGRRRARDVPRPGTAGDQVRRLRKRGQRDTGPAHHSHVGRSRHRARSRRHRPGRVGQPCLRDSAGARSAAASS